MIFIWLPVKANWPTHYYPSWADLIDWFLLWWSDGIKLQGCGTSTKDQRHNPWMGKSGKEEKKTPTRYRWVNNPHRDKYCVFHRRRRTRISWRSIWQFLYTNRVATFGRHQWWPSHSWKWGSHLRQCPYSSLTFSICTFFSFSHWTWKWNIKVCFYANMAMFKRCINFFSIDRRIGDVHAC